MAGQSQGLTESAALGLLSEASFFLSNASGTLPCILPEPSINSTSMGGTQEGTPPSPVVPTPRVGDGCGCGPTTDTYFSFPPLQEDVEDAVQRTRDRLEEWWIKFFYYSSTWAESVRSTSETQQDSLFLGDDLAQVLADRERDALAQTKLTRTGSKKKAVITLASTSEEDGSSVATSRTGSSTEQATTVDSFYMSVGDTSSLTTESEASSSCDDTLVELPAPRGLVPFVVGDEVVVKQDLNNSVNSAASLIGGLWTVVVRRQQPQKLSAKTAALFYRVPQKESSVCFQLIHEGSLTHMTLYEQEILEKVQEILEASMGREEATFRFQLRDTEEALDVSKDQVLDTLQQILVKSQQQEWTTTARLTAANVDLPWGRDSISDGRQRASSSDPKMTRSAGAQVARRRRTNSM